MKQLMDFIDLGTKDWFNSTLDSQEVILTKNTDFMKVSNIFLPETTKYRHLLKEFYQCIEQTKTKV